MAALLACAWCTAESAAAPTYYLLVSSGAYNSTSPITRSEHYTAGNTILTTDAYAVPGRLGAFVEARSNFPSLSSEGGSEFAQAQESTNDFLITGPGGVTSVISTFHFHTAASLYLQGGYPGDDTHSAETVVGVNAAGNTDGGDIFYGNNTASATGLFAGASRNGGDVEVSVYGSFPVGTPFGVLMSVSASAGTFGNSTCSPAQATSDFGTGFPGAGVQIGDATGKVMDLPPGYSLNSATWGVVNNQAGAAPVAGVESPRPAGLAFASVAPNPSATSTDFSFSLPREGVADLAVLDLQGRRIRSLATGRLASGPRHVLWDGRDEAGRAAPPGLYLAVLRFEGEMRVRRVARLR